MLQLEKIHSLRHIFNPKVKEKEPLTKTYNSISTQTEGSSNKGLGRATLRDDPDTILYPLGIETDMPQYRKNLSGVFGEEFLAEATNKDKQLAPIITHYQARPRP